MVVFGGGAGWARPPGLGDEDGRGAESDARRFRRFVIQLDLPCAARYRGSVPGFAPIGRTARAKLDLQSMAARSYLGLLAARQQRFVRMLRVTIPDAEIQYRFKVVFNGLVVRVPVDTVHQLSRLPHVKRVRSTDRVLYTPSLDVSIPWIGAPEFWAENGGETLAGATIKVAVIDSGIDHTNPFFDVAGLAYPEGFPRGALDFTTPKVIAARAYFRPDDPVDPEKDAPNPMDHGGHGSHCAGIIAGAQGTVFDMGGYQAEVSGVAPQAQLMNYKVFYTALSGTEGALEPELMAAFEDAVIDGADVISNSWGGPDVYGLADPSLAVYEAAVEAGSVVVFAAGNEGPGDGSIASPGIGTRFITVGATATGRQFTRYLEVTEPAPVPAFLTEVVMSVGRISPSINEDVGPAPLVSAYLVAGGSNADGCADFGTSVFADAIALLRRGNCTFSEKIEHAAAAGALAVIVQNNVQGEGVFAMNGDDVSVPAVMVSYQDGQSLRTWAADYNDAKVALRAGLIPYPVAGERGQVVAFSSRGPTAWATLKPDIVAPGTLILSADAHAVGSASQRIWGLKGGTSMATPHVAGVAALLKQAHPAWNHDQIKSALTARAVRQGLVSYTGLAATTLEIGAGAVDMTELLEIPVWADPPILNLGEVEGSETATALLHIEARAPTVGQIGLSWHADLLPDGVTLKPPSGTVVTLDDQGCVEVEVSATVADGNHPRDIAGHLLLEDNAGSSTRVPFFVRAAAERGTRDLLIVDLSFASENETASYLPIYEETAQAIGLTYDVAQGSDVAAAPPLPNLWQYQAVLLFTGDDVWYGHSDYGLWTLDRISSFVVRGGGLIVTGQGPLRQSSHTRLAALVGTATDPGFPLRDENGQLVSLGEYRVTVFEAPHFISGPMFLYQGLGSGDLSRLGELAQAVTDITSEPWTRPVLRMQGDVFDGGGVVGMVYDPYLAYGKDPLAESQRHRALFLGFGLEVVADSQDATGPSPAPGSRAELLKNAFEWVSDRVTLEVAYARTDRDVTFRCTAAATRSDITEFTYDFGDGSETVITSAANVDHLYPRFGVFTVTVTAKSGLGAAAVVRRSVSVQPGSEGVDAAVPVDAAPRMDAQASKDASTAEIAPTAGGCRCNHTSTRKSRSICFLLLLFAAIGFWVLTKTLRSV
jgi:subtilisin family serine protease